MLLGRISLISVQGFQKLPEALAWGQANSQGEGVVRRGSPDEPMQHEEEERMAERAQETQAPGLRRILDGLAR